jgi:hypothetical protein
MRAPGSRYWFGLGRLVSRLRGPDDAVEHVEREIFERRAGRGRTNLEASEGLGAVAAELRRHHPGRLVNVVAKIQWVVGHPNPVFPDRQILIETCPRQ